MPQRPHDNASREPEQALRDGSPDQWEQLLSFLPKEAFEQAREQHAFVRARGLRHPADLLRGILVYVFCLGSFRQLGAWAKSIGLSESSERAWAKRTRQAASWLLWLVQTMLAPLAGCQPVSRPESFAGRIHLVDATHLRIWSRSGESRRLHLSYDLLASRLEQVLLTEHHTGEGLRHFHFSPGDLVVADSAYCRRQAILEQLDAGVQVVVRLHWSSTPLLCADGQTPFALSNWLRQVQASGEGEAEVVIQGHKRQQSLRLLAVRLSEDAAKRAHGRRKTHARKHGRINQDLTIQLADWLLVLTSLPAPLWSREQVLSLYRARWQIELLFKRIKQLVRLHRLRSNVMQSNQAVLAALLVGWVLMEQQAARARTTLHEQQAPEAAPISGWELCAVLVQSLRSMLLGCWTWAQIQQHLGDLRRLLEVHPQMRSYQQSQITEQLQSLLALVHP